MVAALWEEHRRWVAAVLLAHKPDEADLDDLLQDVAVTLVDRLGELRDGGALRPWLRTVAVNTARMAARKGRVRRVVRPLGEDDDRHADPVAARDALAIEERDRLAHVLDLVRRLSPEYREPLLLRAVEGMSQREVAAVLALPETTVETRLARARAALRRHLVESERAPAPGSPATSHDTPAPVRGTGSRAVRSTDPAPRR